VLKPIRRLPTPAPTPAQPPLGKNPTREIYAASATLGTQLSRAFDIGGEHVKKLKHTIEPEVDYLYIPDVNQNDLPTYDFVDKIDRRNLITYGFTSRLLAKLDRAGLVELLPPDGGVRVPIVTRDGKRRIRLGIDATLRVRSDIANLAPDRRTQLVAAIDALDDTLRPPRRQWWLD